MKKRDGRKLPPFKIKWIYQEPTTEQTGEIQRELDKFYFPFFDDIWKKEGKKTTGDHL